MTLKEWAERRDMPYAAIAEYVGCHPSQISRIASGTQWPTADLARRIMRECSGVSWDDWLKEHAK